jgi:hypothetical protein
LLIIKKSGHVPMEETPETVYQSINDFVDQKLFP